MGRSKTSLCARALLLWAASSSAACGDGKPAEPAPPCEAECQDRVALRALRETLKLVYNLTLQGKPVGPQDASMSCPLGGRARVSGFATSNPEQGANELELEYVLEACAYLKQDAEPEENFAMGFEGIVRQSGVLAIQPSATTALVFSSESLSMLGMVYDPPLNFSGNACAVMVAQNGRNISGTFCGRPTGLEL
jgi:hypothetical protein